MIARSPRRLRWWQLRTEDFALFLYVLFIPRILAISIFVMILTTLDNPEKPVDLSNFAAWNLTAYFQWLWGFLGVAIMLCAITAKLERAYGPFKWLLVFISLSGGSWLAMRTVSAAFESPFLFG